MRRPTGKHVALGASQRARLALAGTGDLPLALVGLGYLADDRTSGA